ncbi:hypothetical protein FJZ21_04130 [Candidatus Pacearchaeota archaeon]|nr:hypothetical protein [Candidatus Pacearchaeota archaeon]
MNQVFKIPLILYGIYFLFSFGYIGLYQGVIATQEYSLTIDYVFLSAVGALLMGLVIFVPALIISYIYYKSKVMKWKK